MFTTNTIKPYNPYQNESPIYREPQYFSYDSPTQLEDISNQVSQLKIGDNKLRNEEIRRRMEDPWSAPEGRKISIGSQPSSLKENPSLANLYGKTRSSIINDAAYSGTNLNKFTGNDYDGSYGGLGWLSDRQSGMLKQGMNIAGNYAGLPGLVTGALSTVVPGIFGSKSSERQSEDVQNLISNTALGSVVPGASMALQAGTGLYNKLFGTNYDWNPARGLKAMFSGVPYDYMGRVGGGFFTAPTPMSGEATTNNTYSGSGYGNNYGPGSSYKGETNTSRGGNYTPTNGSVGTNNTYSGSGYGNTAGPGSNYTSPASSDSDGGW